MEMSFHTVGMKFPIDIYFFDGMGRKQEEYLNVQPGQENISSEGAQYVVECLPRKENKK